MDCFEKLNIVQQFLPLLIANATLKIKLKLKFDVACLNASIAGILKVL